jgi:hypothetical protein
MLAFDAMTVLGMHPSILGGGIYPKVRRGCSAKFKFSDSLVSKKNIKKLI